MDRHSFLPPVSHLLGCLLLAFTLPLAAQNQPPVQPNPAPFSNGRIISLHEAIAQALVNNFDIKVEELNPLIYRAEIDQAWGAFMPRYFFQYQRQFNIKEQNTVELQSNGQFVTFEQDNDSYKTGLQALSPIGTEVQFLTTLDILDNTLNRQGPSGDLNALRNIFSPEYEAFAGITVKQPFLKNFGFDANLFEVRRARLNMGTAEYNRQVLVTNKVVEVIDAYYDLVFGQEDEQVKRDVIRSAEELLRENKRRQNVGLMAPIDVAEAEVKLSEAREKYIQSQDFVRERRARLLKLVSHSYNLPELPVFHAEPLTATLFPELSERDLLSGACFRRPDYRYFQQELDLERNNIGYVRSQNLPELNFDFTYGLNGFANTVRTSYARVIDFDKYRWSAGVTFSIPIPDKSGHAERLAALRRKSQAELRLRKLEMSVPIDIQNSVAHYRALQQGLATSRDSRRLAEEALKVEQARLEQGKTTTRNVLDLQDKAADARTREIAARAEIHKALNEVWTASGLLLPKNGFSFEDGLGGTHSEVFESMPNGNLNITSESEPSTPPGDRQGWWNAIRFGHR